MAKEKIRNNRKSEKNELMVFSRWSRDSFAVFNSLNKIIKISVLLITYSLVSYEVYASNDTISSKNNYEEYDTLPEVEISGQEPGIVTILKYVPLTEISYNQSYGADAGDLSQNLPGVDIRQRGVNGVQGDISFRGGSPEQVRVMLNGIPVSDPQTGHHNLNLTIPSISTKHIFKYSPAAGQQLGAGAWSGAVNFVNDFPEKSGFDVWIHGGSHDYVNASAAGHLINENSKHHIGLEWKSSSGYTENTDFRSFNSYYHGKFIINEILNTEIQAGKLQKDFGAMGFYSAKYPEQYEKTETNLFSLSLSNNGKFNINPVFYFRQNMDRFELFREDIYNYSNGYFISGDDTAKYVPGNYSPANYYSGHNYHKTNVLGYKLNFAANTSKGLFKGSLNHKHEKILSNVLGNEVSDPLAVESSERGVFDKRAVRDIYNLSVLYQTPVFKKISAGITALSHYSKNYGMYYYGGGRMQYIANEALSYWMSLNQNMRLPSFTDLYYSGPQNSGNPDLKPEKSTGIELGLYSDHGTFDIQTQVFYSRGSNMIDWVKDTEDNKYKSMNHTRLDTRGAEISISGEPFKKSILYPWIKSISANYTYLDKIKYDGNLISAYALDYLKHDFNLELINKIKNTGLSFKWNISYNDRNGSYTRLNQEIKYQSYFKFDGIISYSLENAEMFLSVYNFTDQKIREFGNIMLPGIWIKGGINISINYN